MPRCSRHTNRSRTLALSLVLLLAVAAVPVPAAASVTGIVGGNVTSDVVNQTEPDVWNGIIAWQDYRNGALPDIYANEWYVPNEFTVCTASGNQVEPAVGDDIIVWDDLRSGSHDIWAYDTVSHTEELICNATNMQTSPDVFQRYIVWEDWRSGNADIWAYDLILDEEFSVCVATGAQEDPAIWGDTIVWVDRRLGNGDIWYKDLSLPWGPMPISSSSYEQTDVDICDETVVWTEDEAGNMNIHSYNLSTQVFSTVYAASGDQFAPRIDGDWVLFQDAAVDAGDIGFVDLLAAHAYSVFPTIGTSANPSMHRGTAVYTFDNGGDTEIMAAEPTWTHDTEELEGSDRYATCAAIARSAFPYGSRDVLIATGANFPDALGAAALAGERNIPIILTRGDHLSPAAANALIDLGVNDDVIVVGSAAAVSETVVNEIKALLPAYDSVTRYGGSDRYATAVLIANAVAGSAGGLDEPYGIVVTGTNYPDALSASSMAYALDIPIYLCPGTSISSATISAMQHNGVEKPIIIGSTSAVSAAVENSLKSTFGSANVTRVWGLNRYETAAEVASFSQSVFAFGASGVCIATGESFPDALAGGALAGGRQAPILLTATNSLSAATDDWLYDNSRDIRWATFLGGTPAVSDGVRTQVDDLLH